VPNPPALRLTTFTKSLQVTHAILFINDVVLAGYVEDWKGKLGHELLQRVEFGRPRQMCEIAGVEDERRLLRFRFDPGDRRAQCGGDVGVGRLVEADVTVAYLNEPQSAAGRV
jgi:hypothetical protein